MSSNPLETPKGFRYPVYTDSPDVPRDLQNLAGDIDSYLSINKGPGYLVFSRSSITMGYGSLVFNTPKNSSYNPGGSGAYVSGDRVRIIYTTTPSIFMEGVITSVSADTSITVNIDTLNGSGTYATWQLSLSGIQGLQGRQGVQGLQGLQGLQGVQGTQGTQGIQGIQGTQGNQGLQGIQGVQGTQGLQGVQGTQGIQGVQGTQGLQGVQGTQGIQGRSHIGVTSVTSNTVGTGPKTFSVTYSGDFSLGENVIISYASAPSNYMIGNITSLTLDSSITVNVTTIGGSGTYSSWTFASSGIQGIQGPQGLQGPQGTQGIQGVQGNQGTQGIQGLQGPQGTQGIQGVQGLQGNQGLQGSLGLQGTQGTQGIQGLLGSQGSQGTQGTQGANGLQGAQGIQGPISSQNAHQSVKAVQTSALGNGAFYYSGSADAENGTGVGAYIQAATNGALVIDSYTVVVGDRVLVAGQSTSYQNGIYTVTSTGSVSTTWKLTRATDYDNHAAGQVENGDWTYVTGGTVYAKTAWIQIANGSNSDGTIKIGTDAITFTQTSGLGVQGITGAQGAGGVISYWGSFFDVTTQTISSTTTAYPIAIGNSDPNSKGISVVSGNQLTFAYTGVYNIQYSLQFFSDDSNGDVATVWLRKNGTDIADSASQFGIPGTGHGGTGQFIANAPINLSLNAGDYIQFMWTASSTSVKIDTLAAGTTPTTPVTPGVIVTANQIAYAVQGTQGIQGIQGLQGSQGTGIQGLSGTQGTQGIQGTTGGLLTPTSYISQGRLANDFTLTSGSDQLVPFVSDFDPQGWWNASTKRLTPTIAGYYLIDYQVWWGTGASGNTGQNNIQARKNGSTFIIDQVTINSNNGYTLGGSKAVYLNGSTDYVDFTAYTSNTTSQVIQYGGNSNGQGSFFTATLITSGTVQGLQGLQGSTGAGVQGTQGIQGNLGLQGNQGLQGLQGFGYAQLQGTQGVQGTQGLQGVQGTQGLQGVQGSTGAAPALNIDNTTLASATSYTLASTDAGKLIISGSSSATTITVPASVFTAGQVITIQQGAAGQITFSQGSGVTITSTGATTSAPKTRTTYSGVDVVCLTSSTFTIFGDIA